ncbi:hypothetical protein B0H66DRAFT_341272 [Apodospora peruviana]|uniref:DUF7598 domain-containing protein n=1 Tax=Apodospora peruviana TaxID=516989 RepID=A0AAE0HZ41_9PEZI|nr:hypothetical protein B0H66DRAFT_341272 [Apodospora peruviana]
MFTLSENSKVLGSGHLILNALRAFNIIGLGVVMVASWAMIVISGLTGKFFFFDTVSHFFAFGVSVFLVISELNLFKGYFERNWPVLSATHTLAWLGLAMIIIGCQILGDLVKPAYTLNNLGLAMWRLVLSAGILSITFGVFNVIASIIFRGEGISTRQIRSDGRLAAPVGNGKDGYYDNYSQASYGSRDDYSHRSNTLPQEKEHVSATRRFTRMLNVKNLRKSRIQISKPFNPVSQTADIERGDDDHLNDRQSPIMPAIQRPPTALHPAFTGGSRYSEAHMDRF